MYHSYVVWVVVDHSYLLGGSIRGLLAGRSGADVEVVVVCKPHPTSGLSPSPFDRARAVRVDVDFPVYRYVS